MEASLMLFGAPLSGLSERLAGLWENLGNAVPGGRTLWLAKDQIE